MLQLELKSKEKQYNYYKLNKKSAIFLLSMAQESEDF